MKNDLESITRRLAQDAGDWVGEETMPAPDGSGGTVTAQAKVRARMAAGGGVLVNDYRQTIGGEVTIEGHAVTRWDAEADRLVMTFYDGKGNPPADAEGGYQGKELVLEGEAHGGRLRHRTVHPDADTMRTVSEMSFDGGETWQQVFEGTYRRVEG